MNQYGGANGKKKKYDAEMCDNKMTFEECELAVLRHAVDETEKLQGQKIANSVEIKKILTIVETFIKTKRLICYGGTAINNILPKHAQFYNKEIEIPDYDFYSDNALHDAKELADIYYKAGYTEVEAKAGVHMGTFKVFVNFIPIADITQMHPSIFKIMGKSVVTVAGIRYAPPDFLRMGMFLELSRPAGDVSRWEKVMKRLTLLNKYYPLEVNIDCHKVDFQRKMETNTEDSERLHITVRDAFIDEGVVFFGGYATSLYSKHMPEAEKRIASRIPDFDVLSEDPERTALIVTERLTQAGFKKVKTVSGAAIGETIPEHKEIMVDGETLAFIYKPIACHSFNTIPVDKNKVNIATIDTILSFYLSFLFSDLPYNKERLLCMAKFLFDVEQENRLAQRGLLKRFSIECYGKQPTLEEMRAEKSEKFKELADKKDSKEYEMWFLKYSPGSVESGSGSKQKGKRNKKSRKNNRGDSVGYLKLRRRTFANRRKTSYW
jgi:hypothetical protein